MSDERIWELEKSSPALLRQIADAPSDRVYVAGGTHRTFAILMAMLLPGMLAPAIHFGLNGELLFPVLLGLGALLALSLAAVSEARYRLAGKYVMLDSELVWARGIANDKIAVLPYERIEGMERVGEGGQRVVLRLVLDSGERVEVGASEAWTRGLEGRVGGGPGVK